MGHVVNLTEIRQQGRLSPGCHDKAPVSRHDQEPVTAAREITPKAPMRRNGERARPKPGEIWANPWNVMFRVVGISQIEPIVPNSDQPYHVVFINVKTNLLRIVPMDTWMGHNDKGCRNYQFVNNTGHIPN